VTSASPQTTPEAVTAAPFARILVGSIPTDQGAAARALALELARLCDAHLQLVSVMEARWLDHLGEQTGPAAIHHDEQVAVFVALKQATEQLSRAIGADRIQQRLEVSSSAARGLHDAAVDGRADLIVVGSSHRGSIGRVLLGSVGERLLAGAPCAVAVAARGHASKPPRPLDRILVAFDGSPEARLALRAAHTLAKRAGATLAVVTVVVPSAPGVAVGQAVPLSGLDVVIPAADTERRETIRLAEALERQENAAWATLEAATAELDDRDRAGGARRPRRGQRDPRRRPRSHRAARARLALLRPAPPHATRQRLKPRTAARALPRARHAPSWRSATGAAGRGTLSDPRPLEQTVRDPRHLTAEPAGRTYDRIGRIQDLQAIHKHHAIRELLTHAAFEHAHAVFELGFGTGALAKRCSSPPSGQPARRNRDAAALARPPFLAPSNFGPPSVKDTRPGAVEDHTPDSRRHACPGLRALRREALCRASAIER
jgi:nucleotide-binding universal stress UspA family protein